MMYPLLLLALLTVCLSTKTDDQYKEIAKKVVDREYQDPNIIKYTMHKYYVGVDGQGKEVIMDGGPMTTIIAQKNKETGAIYASIQVHNGVSIEARREEMSGTKALAYYLKLKIAFNKQLMTMTR